MAPPDAAVALAPTVGVAVGAAVAVAAGVALAATCCAAVGSDTWANTVAVGPVGPAVVGCGGVVGVAVGTTAVGLDVGLGDAVAVADAMVPLVGVADAATAVGLVDAALAVGLGDAALEAVGEAAADGLAARVAVALAAGAVGLAACVAELAADSVGVAAAAVGVAAAAVGLAPWATGLPATVGAVVTAFVGDAAAAAGVTVGAAGTGVGDGAAGRTVAIAVAIATGVVPEACSRGIGVAGAAAVAVGDAAALAAPGQPAPRMSTSAASGSDDERNQPVSSPPGRPLITSRQSTTQYKSRQARDQAINERVAIIRAHCSIAGVP